MEEAGEVVEAIAGICAGKESVIIVAGLGAGTGTGIAPMVARIDRYAERLAVEQPGFQPTRSDAIRILLHKGLDAEELDEGMRR